jgi:hypothetical protein
MPHELLLSRRLPPCFDWKSRVLPGLEPALQGVGIVPVLLKFLRQTGARAFVRSSAVGDDGLVFGDSGQIPFEIVDWNSDRFRYLGVRFGPSLRIADVNDCEILACVHSSL